MIELSNIKETYSLIKSHLYQTPLAIRQIEGRPFLAKLESMQRGGSFKIRGALSNVLRLQPEQLAKGLTAVSGGNHAVAVSLVAQIMKTTAKVVMPRELASQYRIALCESLGAKIELPYGRMTSFQRAQQIAKEEERFFVPPFDAIETILGNATLGLEIFDQHSEVERVYVAIGGGGLAAGVAAALKLLNPHLIVIGVEPSGADLMKRSLLAHTVVKDESVSSIAESLTPPFVGEHCLAYCERYLDDVITVTDSQIIDTLRILDKNSEIFAEPSGVVAICGFLQDSPTSKNTVCIVSGANISPENLSELIKLG